MDTNDIVGIGPGHGTRSGCLIAGCPCMDTRILSHRRARFYAHLARVSGETSRRVIRPEPGWKLPRSA